MLAKTIKSRMLAAMKARSTVEKEILRVVLGEVDVAQVRSETPLDDQAVQGIVRKLIKSNQETLEQASGDTAKVLEEENEVLRSLLPRTLSVSEIVEALTPVAQQIRSAKADGPGAGIAMKHLKGQGSVVEGKDVMLAVQELRR